MILSTPLKKAIFFIIFPFVFYLLDFLNYSRAGKIAVIGFFMIGLFSSLNQYFSNSRFFHYLYKLIVIIIFINMSFHAFLRDIFGVEQDSIIVMQTIFGTDINEVKEFLIQYKFYLLKHFTIFLVSLTIYFTITNSKDKEQIDYKSLRKTVIIFAIFFLLIHLNPTLRRSNPFVYFPYYYIKWEKTIALTRQLDSQIKNKLNSSLLSTMHYTGNNRKKTVVFVIGESDTKHNWSLYGYQRETNPKMRKLQNELLIFRNIYAAGPNTISSIEKMLTPATRKEPDLWKRMPDILLMAKQAGYKTYWISNHTTDTRGVINIFASHADEFILTNKGKSRGEGSYDEEVILPYKKALDDNYDRKFIIVHLLGSHPAYDFRYPKKYSRFTYIFDDDVISNLKNKGISSWALIFRNLYDNTILYSDTIRYQLLTLLKNSKENNHSSWLYLSDHGQDVCHHSNYSGHNFKAKEQWEIPMIFWSSEKQYDKNITNYFYSADFIDHALLGLMDIEGDYYNPYLDIFSNHFNEKNVSTQLTDLKLQ
jgi:heptose-I-phosphate ethanolaminephosphotransferase